MSARSSRKIADTESSALQRSVDAELSGLPLERKSSPAAEEVKARRSPQRSPVTPHNTPVKSVVDTLASAGLTPIRQVRVGGKTEAVVAETASGERVLVDLKDSGASGVVGAAALPASVSVMSAAREKGTSLVPGSFLLPLQEWCAKNRCTLALLCEEGICTVDARAARSDPLVYTSESVAKGNVMAGSAVPLVVTSLAAIQADPEGVKVQTEQGSAAVREEVVQSQAKRLDVFVEDTGKTLPEIANAAANAIAINLNTLNDEIRIVGGNVATLGGVAERLRVERMAAPVEARAALDNEIEANETKKAAEEEHLKGLKQNYDIIFDEMETIEKERQKITASASLLKESTARSEELLKRNIAVPSPLSVEAMALAPVPGASVPLAAM